MSVRVTRFPSFFQSAAGEAEPRDAAPPQESLHPAETSGGPAAGRGGLPLQDHTRDLQDLRVSMVDSPGSPESLNSRQGGPRQL